MLSSLDARTQRFLNDLDRIDHRLTRAQEQVASGRRINRASDAPDEISGLLAARSQLASTLQIKSNFNRIKSETDAAEQSLSQAVSLLDRVAALGAEGATDILDPEQKRIIASELAGLQQQLVGLASTATDGRYLFGGDFDQQAPYLYSASDTPPYGTYRGSTATRQVQHPAGIRINLSLSADQIFEDPDSSRNVFGAVESLRQSLLAGSGAAVVGQELAKVRTAAVHLNNQLAFYGQVQSQVASAIDYASTQEIRLRTQISSAEDADLAAAAVELTQAQTHQQAALQAEARVQNRPSLFDFLR